jgi:hypothetical protein
VSLLTELYAFFTKHRRCSDLDSAVKNDRIWLTCTCGAAISRRINDD